MGLLATACSVMMDMCSGLSANLKALLRFVIWQWKAKPVFSRIRSSQVALRATIGKRVLIEKGVFVDGLSSIGDYSYINCFGSIENASIGRFCSIARGAMIGPAEHDYSNLSSHPFWYQSFYGFRIKEPLHPVTGGRRTTIQDDVWIGINAIIRRGVTLHTGAVIGAGSVVTKDVGPYEIWGGVPAKKIKQRFENEVIEELLKLGWCNFPVEEMENNVIPNISDIQAVITNASQKVENTP